MNPFSSGTLIRLSLFSFLLFVPFSHFLLAQPELDRAFSYLEQNREAMGLEAEDLEDLLLVDRYTSRHNGLTHLYFQQRNQGVGVYNAMIGLHVSPGLRVFDAGHSLIPNLRTRLSATSPAINAPDALRGAASAMGWSLTTPVVVLKSPVGPAQEQLLDKSGISLEPIPAKLSYLPRESGIVALTWEFIVFETSDDHVWTIHIDALNGSLLDTADAVIWDHWGTPTGAHDADHCQEQPVTAPNFHAKNGPARVNNPDSYLVYPIPLEDPDQGPRTLVTNPADLIASPFGWHDTNGSPGAEYTITRGNNVFAYEDRDANNSPGHSPDGGSSLDFSFPVNFANQPPTYEDAAITNLFYWNNVIHDIFYHYGFDEPAGNFQENNYGNGGQAGDAVRAEAQDGSGTNNANFFTFPDGGTGRMQMFQWSPTNTPFMTVNSPPQLAGTYVAVEAGFGPGLPQNPASISGNPVLVNANTTNPTNGCGFIQNGSSVNGNIALIDRGGCSFVTKVRIAQNTGAIMAIICNNVPGGAIPMSNDGTGGDIVIPSVMISKEDCDSIKAYLPGVNASFSAVPLPNKDSDFDNGIVIHEYGHGISIRLVGGPGTSGCLSNREQMGEGWSDYFTLMLTMKPGDSGPDVQGVGNYVLSKPVNGAGLRPAGYSTDFGVNDYTYGDINGLAVPHGVGFVWATVLWDMTWALVDQYGFDSDFYTGTGGNNIALQLVVDGLKLTPCSPGFVQGRDAILLADSINYGGANSCIIWEAFAARGLGVSATQGSSGSVLDQTEAFDVPVSCAILPVELLTIEATPKEEEILLEWTTLSELANAGFGIQRSREPNSGFLQIGWVDGQGNSNSLNRYEFHDTEATPGQTWYYRLRQVDIDGNHTFSRIVSARIPSISGLNVILAPNPATSQALLSVSELESPWMGIRLLDLLGNSYYRKTFLTQETELQIPLDLAGLAQGVYLVVIQTEKGTLTKKLFVSD